MYESASYLKTLQNRMKKSKSMVENGNIYSGDDEGFESAPEKVVKHVNDI